MALGRAAEAGLRTLLRYSGVTVTYRRGSESAEVRLLLVQRGQPAEQEHALTMNWSTADWVGLREDLVLAGERTLPQVDDRIEVETEDGMTVWTVAPKSQQQWTPQDNRSEIFRVHTVRLT